MHDTWGPLKNVCWFCKKNKHVLSEKSIPLNLDPKAATPDESWSVEATFLIAGDAASFSATAFTARLASLYAATLGAANTPEITLNVASARRLPLSSRLPQAEVVARAVFDSAAASRAIGTQL